MAATEPKVLKQVEIEMSIGGKVLSDKYEFQSVSISKEFNKIPTAVVSIVDGNPAKQDFELSASTETSVEPGKEVEIKVKWGATKISLYKGVIMKHGLKIRANATVMVLDCKDKAVKMTLNRINMFWEKKKDSEVITDLIKAGGAKPSVDATTFKHPEVVKYDCNDWDFMMLRAELNGLLVNVKEGTVEVKKPVFTTKKNLLLAFGSNVIEFESEIDARTQIKAANSTSWNMKTQKVEESKQTAPGVTVPEVGNITASTLSAVTSPDQINLYHPGPELAANLTDWSKAQMLKSRLAKVKGRVKTYGFEVALGDIIELKGFGTRFNGEVYVTGVRHTVFEGEWLTTVQFGLSERWFAQQFDLNVSAFGGQMPGMAGLQIGKVKALEGDPDSEFRIQVTFPMTDAKAHVWCRMAFEYAGKKRGHFYLPEIDDEVVVGFLNDDPRYPIVLGSLYSSKAAPPITASDDNHEKGWFSRSDMQIVFDDDKKVMTLSTPAGNKMTFDEDKKLINITDQHGNKMTMEKSGITIKSVGEMTLEAAKNITIKSSGGDIAENATNINHTAKAKYVAKGNGGAELQTSAIAIVKGSMVKIN